jgi:hypothetical protein
MAQGRIDLSSWKTAEVLLFFGDPAQSILPVGKWRRCFSCAPHAQKTAEMLLFVRGDAAACDTLFGDSTFNDGRCGHGQAINDAISYAMALALART